MMKLVPHSNFPRLGQWIPFLQQVEETSDDIGDSRAIDGIDDIGDLKEIDDISDVDGIDVKEIDATEFQKFCTLIDPTEEDKKREEKEFQDSIVPFRPAPPRPPSRYDRAISHIKKLGLEQNIALVISDTPSGEHIISGVEFRCLKIKEHIEINFSTFLSIKFVNNTFCDYVKISTPDAFKIMAIFIGNKFLRSFDLHVTNTLFTIIRNNDVFHSMNVSFTFLPSSNVISNKIQNTPLPQWGLEFSDNKVCRLFISDISKASDWRDAEDDYPLELIRFKGGNRIWILIIVTKYTTLTPHLPLKSDINRISFYASDKIGFSTPATWPISDMKEYGHSQDNNDLLAYGRFFSLLETLSSKQHDRVNEDIYRRKARYFYRKFLPLWKDRFIFYWTNWFSKDGTSWIHPIFWLMGTEALLAGIAYYFSIGWDLTNFMEKDWKFFLTLFAWFMNPASLLPLPTLPLDKEIIAESLPLYVLFLFQKIFAAAFYYEAVKALRRFTR